MEAIGFLGQVKDSRIEELESKGVIVLNKNKQLIQFGLNFIQEKLKKLNVHCDWEAGYENGIIEFIVESEDKAILELCKETISNFSGNVTFLDFC